MDSSDPHSVDKDLSKQDSAVPSVLNFIVSAPESREGAIRAGLLLGKHLKSYVDVDVVKMTGEYDDELAQELDVEFSSLRTHTWLRNFFRRMIGSTKNYSNTLIWCEIDMPRPLREYDLVHIHNSVPLLGMIQIAFVARFHGIPYCVTTHGISKVPELPEQMGMPRPVEIVYRIGYVRPYYWVLKNANHIFALSNQDAESIYNLFPSQSVSVTPNGVELNPSDVTDNTLSSSIPIDSPFALFVGKIRASKGIEDLIKGYKQINSDIPLVVVGAPQNEQLVGDLENTDGIHYLGYIDKDDLQYLYNKSDLFVFPTRSDVFPLVTLEAMAAATPVIATEVGGIPEQVSDNVGIIVPPKNPSKLSDAIEKLLDKPDIRQSMGYKAHKRINNKFTWAAIAKQVASKYKEICGMDD